MISAARVRGGTIKGVDLSLRGAKMSFWSEYKKNFTMYANFKGRAGKREYRIIVIPYMLNNVLNTLIARSHKMVNGNLQVHGDVKALYVASILFLVGLFLPFLAASFRRAHDAGHSGWWVWIPFYEYVLLFKDSDPSSNLYGDPVPGSGLGLQRVTGKMRRATFFLTLGSGWAVLGVWRLATDSSPALAILSILLSAGYLAMVYQERRRGAGR